MRLLIFTQKVDENDDHFTFFLDWIREFASHYECVTVVTLWKGSFNLPPNVKVLSLGKESGELKIKYLYNFYSYIFKYKDFYDHVFVHMNPIYIVLGGIFWRLWQKKISLWYTHRHVDLKLIIATQLSDVIFTASGKSFRITTPKLNVVGHGINTDMFKCDSERVDRGETKIITVSRIARIKNLETFIKAISILSKKIKTQISAEIISKIPKDTDSYYLSLKTIIKDLGVENTVHFVGAMPGKDLPKKYCESDLSVNLTPSGGIDKAVLESMSCGLPCFFSNDALIPEVGEYKDKLMFDFGNPEDLALKMENFLRDKSQDIGSYLRGQVVERHDYKKFIKNLVNKMK